MKYCSNCGTHLDDTAVFCPTCGTSVSTNYSTPGTANVPPQSDVSPTDAPSAGFWWLGFLFWYVGLILFFAYKNKSPQRAKSALKGAIVALIIPVVLIVVLILVLLIVSVINVLVASRSYEVVSDLAMY